MTRASDRLELYPYDTLIKGQPASLECADIFGQRYAVARAGVSILGLEDDWYEDVKDPEAVIAALQESEGFKPDIFTFWQRLPEIEPRYSFHTEWEEIAALRIQDYSCWWEKQIDGKTRNMVRRAEKKGVVVRQAEFDDNFVEGMVSIFNECPVRQGRKFWHYGKDFETVKRQFSRFIQRETMIGAYYSNELIGLIMLGDAGLFGLTGQVISAIKHRDKSTNNALIAKAVEVCAQREMPYLIYYYWSDDSLAEFKRRCGFERVLVPRYYVPLTAKGKLALKVGAHRGWKAMLPDGVKRALKQLRNRWYAARMAE